MEKAVFIGLGLIILVCLILIIKAGMVYTVQPQDSKSIEKAKKQIHISGTLMMFAIVGWALSEYFF